MVSKQEMGNDHKGVSLNYSVITKNVNKSSVKRKKWGMTLKLYPCWKIEMVFKPKGEIKRATGQVEDLSVNCLELH